MSAQRISVKKEPTDIVDGRSPEDSLRVWDRYRGLAFFWRTVALLQIPIILILMIVTLSMYFSADTIIEVPERPQPGHYSVKKLPDSEFINVAMEVTNLITTFNPITADRQFKAARRYLWTPALEQFESDKIEKELPMIQQLARSQLFFIDTKQIKVERRPEYDAVVVRLPGIRQKLIGNRPVSPDELVVYVRMTTIPKNIYNEFGIVVTDLQFREPGMTTVGGATSAVAPSDAPEAAPTQQPVAEPLKSPASLATEEAPAEEESGKSEGLENDSRQ